MVGRWLGGFGGGAGWGAPGPSSDGKAWGGGKAVNCAAECGRLANRAGAAQESEAVVAAWKPCHSAPLAKALV